LHAVLTVPILFWAGSSFLEGAWHAFRVRTADMNALIAVGTLAAYLYSLAALLFPGWFRAAGVEPQFYFEATAVITTLVLLGRLLEALAKGSTSEAIRKLRACRPVPPGYSGTDGRWRSPSRTSFPATSW